MSKKIIEGNQVSVKDSSGAYLPSYIVSDSSKSDKIDKDPPKSEINLEDLLDKHLLLLYRETKFLMQESVEGKLSKDSAHSMRENLKLIMELKKKEKELLESLSDEDIKQLIQDKL